MITRRHGVYIPPRKKKKNTKSITIRFVITGVIPSKKNRQLAAYNWRSIGKSLKEIIGQKKHLSVRMVTEILSKHRPYIRYSDKYREWEDRVMKLLHEQAQAELKSYEKYGLSFPITRASISVYHYWKDNRVRDNTNRVDGIHDMLKRSGIILDDTWQNLSPTTSDANIYEGEILDHITVIDITAYEW